MSSFGGGTQKAITVATNISSSFFYNALCLVAARLACPKQGDRQPPHLDAQDPPYTRHNKRPPKTSCRSGEGKVVEPSAKRTEFWLHSKDFKGLLCRRKPSAHATSRTNLKTEGTSECRPSMASKLRSSRQAATAEAFIQAGLRCNSGEFRVSTLIA